MPPKKKAPRVVQNATDTTGVVLQVGGDARDIQVSAPSDTASSPDDKRPGQAGLDCFLTHVTVEAPVAMLVKQYIEQVAGRLASVFIAESPDSIGIGEDWLNEIHGRLQSADLLIVLASPASIEKPWINLETGAAWIQGTPFVSLCHSGLRREDLPQPYQSRQSYDLVNPEHLGRFFASLRRRLNEPQPLPLDYAAIAQAFNAVIRSPAP